MRDLAWIAELCGRYEEVRELWIVIGAVTQTPSANTEQSVLSQPYRSDERVSDRMHQVHGLPGLPDRVVVEPSLRTQTHLP